MKLHSIFNTLLSLMLAVFLLPSTAAATGVSIVLNGQTYENIVKISGGGKNDVTLSPTTPSPGAKVRVLLHNEVDDISYRVMDNKGNEIQLLESSSGDYLYFTQPNSRVTLTATITKEEIPWDITTLFSDVIPGSWYYYSVETVYQMGLMTGIDKNSFSPYSDASRGTIATALYQLSDGRTVGYLGSFSDVASNAYQAKAMEWAVDQGLISGYNSGAYAPHNSVTREELALMLYRYEEYKEGTISLTGSASLPYKDSANVSSWAEEAVRWATQEGLIGGRENGNFDPQSTASRGEVAKILLNYVLL